MNDSGESLAECGEFHDVKIYGFWFDGVLLSVVGLIGLFGNIMSLIVLSRPKMRDVFHRLLSALACFDTLYIICGGINYTFRAFDARSDIYTYLFPYFLHPFTQVAMCGTIFMTVAISIERYLGLCHPMLPPSARKTWFYLVPVVTMSLIISGPKFLEVELTTVKGDNGSSPAYGPSELRISEDYIRYYVMWTRLLCTAILPVILLLFLNTRIIVDLFASTKVKRFGSMNRQRKEINLCLVLLCIVLLFFLCHTTRIILDIIEFSHLEKVIQCPKSHRRMWSPPYWAQVLYHVSHFTMMINSSFNFVVYCLVGHTFRREFCRAFGLSGYSAIPLTSSYYANNNNDPSRRSSASKLEYSVSVNTSLQGRRIS
ncbi:FMRFamide receptor [Lepeophtheirus salmonis]|uniref:FMRFamide receptor n=1 Tax=Lepeophtheirus salmonis TaxID=72036 RepID=UPI001AEA80AD|nr:FMRFamide receptor-like [Lepeophtheirus salmonis]